MKPFTTRYTVSECKVRLEDLGSSLFGFIQAAVKLISIGGGNYQYVIRKTMRGNFGHETTLAEVRGELIAVDHQSTVVRGQSTMGRFYKVMLTIYSVIAVFAVVSYLTTQKVSYLFYAGLIVGFAGFGWLLTYYWRNQLEGSIERALMK